jgi:hypothetical protein
MTVISAFDGLRGLTKAVVSDSEGMLLEALGGISSEAENTAALAAVIARQLANAGMMLQLGTCVSIVMRSRDSVLAFVPRKELLGALELDPGKAAPDLEAKLRSTDLVQTEVARPSVRPPPLPPPVRRPAPPAAGKAGKVESTVARTSKGLPAISGPDPGKSIPAEPSKADAVSSPQEPSPFPPLPVSPLSAGRRTPAFGARTAPGENAMFSGNLEMINLPDLLEFFRNGRRTGTLMCTGEHGLGQVRLREGMIVDALSPQSGGSSLAKRLVESGAAAEEQLAALAPGIGTDLDNIHIVRRLIEGGFTDPELVRGAMRKHVQSAIDEMVRWASGKFSFHPGAVSPEIPVASAEFDPHIILLQIFKEQDEADR